MYNNNYTDNSFFLPRQRISDAEKDDGWKIANVQAIMGMATSQGIGALRSTKQEKQINYNLFNGEVDNDNFEYVTDPMGIGNKYGGSSVKLEMHNIVKSKIELLKGEEGARPFNWMVRGVGGQIVTVKEEQRRKMVVSYLQQQVLSQLGLDPQAQSEQQQTPQQIQKYMDTEFMDPREVTANQVLNYVVKRDHVARKFNEGWEHALICAEEIYYIGIKDGHPSVRAVNPIAFEFDKDSDEKFIKDSEWVREERYLHASTVLDLYQEELSEEEIEMIESGNYLNSHMAGMQTGFAYQEGVSPDHRSFANQQNGILVTHVAWRGWKQVTFLTAWDDEAQEVLTNVVPNGTKLSLKQKKEGALLEVKYDKQTWIGTQIGASITVDVRPADVQNGELPYVGYIYNSTNSKATSLMDLMKPHQYAYMIVWWRLMGELAKSKGKKMAMDMAMIPKSMGMDMDQWIYYYDRLDIVWYNSLEEGPKGRMPTQSQFANIDLSMAQVVNQYIMILDKLEQQISQLTGVSPQREAQTMASESATGNNIAMTQSSYITEPLFRYHNEVKKQVLTMILEVAKVAYKDGKKIQYVVDEAYVANLVVDGGTFPDSDYGLFVSDSSKDYQTKQKLEALAQIAMQQDKASFRDMIKLYNSNSMAELESYLVQAEDRKVKQQQEMQKAEQDNQKAIADGQNAAMKDKSDREDARAFNSDKTKIKVAEIVANSRDMNKDGIPDNQEEQKVGIDNLKVANDMVINQQKLSQEKEKSNEEFAVKTEANRIKEKDVDLKYQHATKDRAHEKQMADKEEQMMHKEDQFKDKDFNRTIKLDNHKVNHEAKIGAVKNKVAETSLKVDEKKLTMKMKANKDKVQTAKAMPKPKAKTK